jgi:hypothetical protein
MQDASSRGVSSPGSCHRRSAREPRSNISLDGLFVTAILNWLIVAFALSSAALALYLLLGLTTP